MQAIKLKKLDGKEWDERRKNRVELAQCGGLDALQQLLNQYWTLAFRRILGGNCPTAIGNGFELGAHAKGVDAAR